MELLLRSKNIRKYYQFMEIFPYLRAFKTLWQNCCPKDLFSVVGATDAIFVHNFFTELINFACISWFHVLINDMGLFGHPNLHIFQKMSYKNFFMFFFIIINILIITDELDDSWRSYGLFSFRLWQFDNSTFFSVKIVTYHMNSKITNRFRD